MGGSAIRHIPLEVLHPHNVMQVGASPNGGAAAMRLRHREFRKRITVSHAVLHDSVEALVRRVVRQTLCPIPVRPDHPVVIFSEAILVINVLIEVQQIACNCRISVIV